MTFVAQETPNLPTYGRVIPVIAPSSSHILSPTSRFERFQGLHRKEGAAMHLAQQEQHIRRQMSQSSIPLFIFSPAPIDLMTKQCKLLLEPSSFGMIRWQGIPLLFISGNFLLEFINLSAGAGLSAIKTTSIEEKWPPYLLAVFVHGSCGQQRMAPPIGSQYPFDASPCGQFRFLHFDDKVVTYPWLRVGDRKKEEKRS
jgi:hypothetical protein